MNTTEIIKQAENLNIFPLFTKADLSARWNVKPNVVTNWSIRDNDFCKPIPGIMFSINKNVYPFYEVLRYEQKRGLTVNE